MRKLVERLRAGASRLARQLSLFDAAPPPLVPPEPEGSFAGSAAPAPGGHDGVRMRIAPRLRESWRVTWRPGQGAELEIPTRLASAPAPIQEALVRWARIVSGRSRKHPARREERRGLEKAIREWLADGEEEGRSAELRRGRDGRRLARLNPKGAVHDLEAAFARVNQAYFAGTLSARLTWSRRLGGLSTHSLARDGEGKSYHLISISRGYDDPEVTPEILDGVVYHECLHIAIPPRTEGGRRVVHGRDFRRREHEYAHYEAWRKWHREGLPKALRRLRRRGGF